MTQPSCISPATLSAYRQTHYHVNTSLPFYLEIGVASAALFALYRQSGVDCSA